MTKPCEPAAGASPPHRTPGTVAGAGFVALAVAMGIGRFAFTPILPMMHEDAGLSVAAGGWLASANYLGYLLGALSAMVVRLRAATAIRSGMIAIGATTVAMGLTEHFALWAFLRGLAGVASAWVLIFVSAWCLEKLTPLRRPLLNGAVYAGVGAGIAAAGAVCLALMSVNAGSARAWFVLGLFALLLSVLAWPVFATDLGEPVRDAAPAGRSAARWSGESMRLVFCYGAFGFGYIIPATFLPLMARQEIQDAAVFGWSWPLFGAAALASTFAAALLLRFLSNRSLWIASQLVMALGVALPVGWSGIAAIMVSALTVGGTFMVTTMAGMQQARQIAGRAAASLMAAMTSAFAIGQIAGPLCVSYLADAGGRFGGVLLAASLALVASACALARRPRTAATVRN